MPMVPVGKKRRGRPSKFTAAKATDFLARIQNGSTLKDAAAMIGVNSSTIYQWQKDGVRIAEKAERDEVEVHEDDTAQVDFSVAYARARAEYSERLLETAVTLATGGEGKMLQFLMKADKPDVYGDRQHITADVSTNVVTLYPTSGSTTNTTLVLPEGDE